jgi:hypothetical protein
MKTAYHDTNNHPNQNKRNAASMCCGLHPNALITENANLRKTDIITLRVDTVGEPKAYSIKNEYSFRTCISCYSRYAFVYKRSELNFPIAFNILASSCCIRRGKRFLTANTGLSISC